MAEFSDGEWVKGVVRHDGIGSRSTVGGTVFSSTVKEGGGTRHPEGSDSTSRSFAYLLVINRDVHKDVVTRLSIAMLLTHHVKYSAS